MTEPESAPLPYEVVYAEAVRADLRTNLIPRAKELGLGIETLAALKKLDHILHIYPEYGEPLTEGTTEAQKVCVTLIPPLCVLFGLDSDRRIVYVTQPMKLVPTKR